MKRRNEARHDPEGSFRSLCAICGQPVSAVAGALLWCLGCLGPYIESYRGFEPVITIRRHYEPATERR